MVLADSLHSVKKRLGIRNQNVDTKLFLSRLIFAPVVDWNRNNLRLLNNIDACGARNSNVSNVGKCSYLEVEKRGYCSTHSLIL